MFGIRSSIVLGALAFSTFAVADDAAVKKAPAGPSINDCSKELLLSYFPESFVNETLKKFNVPQDKWAAINSALSQKDKEVVKIVEDKAAKMDPNPLKDPTLRQQAVKIFRDTLFEVFGNVARDNGITDEKQIQAMLDDIQQQKAKRFAQCMEKVKEAEKANPSSYDDEDEEDDDNDMDDSDDKDDDNSVEQKKSDAGHMIPGSGAGAGTAPGASSGATINTSIQKTPTPAAK